MTCCLISPLFLAGFLCTALAPDIYLLYTGRILGGLALGLGSPPAGVLVSEVSTPAWRTTFGSGLSAFYMVGMVITFILGKVGSLSISHCHSSLVITTGSDLAGVGGHLLHLPEPEHHPAALHPRVPGLARHPR